MALFQTRFSDSLWCIWMSELGTRSERQGVLRRCINYSMFLSFADNNFRTLLCFFHNPAHSIQFVPSKKLDFVFQLLPKADRFQIYIIICNTEVCSSPYPFIPALRPTKPRVQWVPGTFLRTKSAGAWRWPPTLIYIMPGSKLRIVVHLLPSVPSWSVVGRKVPSPGIEQRLHCAPTLGACDVFSSSMDAIVA